MQSGLSEVVRQTDSAMQSEAAIKESIRDVCTLFVSTTAIKSRAASTLETKRGQLRPRESTLEAKGPVGGERLVVSLW